MSFLSMKDTGHLSYVLRRSASFFMSNSCMFLLPDCSGGIGGGPTSRGALAEVVEVACVRSDGLWIVSMTGLTRVSAWLRHINWVDAVSLGDMIHGMAITRCGAVAFFTYMKHLQILSSFPVLLFSSVHQTISSCSEKRENLSWTSNIFRSHATLNVAMLHLM